MSLEMADIFRAYGPAYRARYGSRLRPGQRRAMQAIEHCRTEALGGQVYVCPQCDQVRYRYHSCRNRHCPKCQGQNAYQWLQKQQAFLLPVAHFLLTFTLPAPLRPIARQRQRLIYHLLFRASAAATQQLARDPRFLGGQIALVGVLHTWTRDLRFHPHVHYLAPAGALATDGQTWLPARKNFLLPVKALSRLFRHHFRRALQKTDCHALVPAHVWAQDWVVHCKPVGTGQAVFKYLAPYIFRVAISNPRLVKLEQDQVTFCYKSSQTGQTQHCTLAADAFLHRFLQHVLPSPNPASDQGVRCPVCGQAMQVQRSLPPTARCPP